MAKLLLVAAVASAMWGAGNGGNAIPSKPEVTLAQLDHDGDNWRYYRDGACRDATFREQRGEEVVIRHVRRCD